MTELVQDSVLQGYMTHHLILSSDTSKEHRKFIFKDLDVPRPLDPYL